MDMQVTSEVRGKEEHIMTTAEKSLNIRKQLDRLQRLAQLGALICSLFHDYRNWFTFSAQISP
jgi:hypothetical protein